MILTLLLYSHMAFSTTLNYQPGLVEKTSKEFLIPRELRTEIETRYLAFVRKNNPKIILPDEEVLARIPREFLSVELRFRSSSPGVLRDHTVFRLPRGGGEIDLKHMVIGSKGSFFLTFDVKRASQPEDKPQDLQIYFYSNVKPQMIGKEKYGSDCHKYMDVTSTLLAANSDKGLTLNATDQRYLPVVGGVFYFIDFSPERKIYIAAVRIKDTRYPEENCPELQ